MSVIQICDVCNEDLRSTCHRYKFNEFKWDGNYGTNKFDLDICESCFAKFKEFVKEEDK